MGGFAGDGASCSAGVVPAGGYLISVGSASHDVAGDFELHVQFLPAAGTLRSTRLDGRGVTNDRELWGVSHSVGSCAAVETALSAEDMRWFASCGGNATQSFSVFPANGGTTWEPVAGKRGISAVFIDSRGSSNSGTNFHLAYDVPPL
jgi:hypothetical protein